MASYDPRRRSVLNPEYNPFDYVGQQNASYNPPGVGPPDAAPPGAPPSPVDTPGGGDLWGKLMAMLKGYGDVGMFEQNRAKLDPFIAQAMKGWGLDENTLLSKVAYNPLKAMYTMNSMLTGTPYYDKGNAADGSETWSPFFVPGWDYDPATPGVQAPSWYKDPYDPSKHVFRT